MNHMRVSNLAAPYYRKVVAHQLSRDFAKATEIVTVPFPQAIRPTEIVVRNLFAGVNASDINYTAGVYKANTKPPFDVGFEGLGMVVAVGGAVKDVDLHDHVLTQNFGTFSEYQVVPLRNVRKIPKPDPRYLALEVSGVTASIALDKVLEPQQGEVALVTAAAGGTGQFAVQLLKHKYGCHVIGTCSSAGKETYLKSIGVDRVVNYKREDLDAVLHNEYKRGVNVVYESVGGRMFDLALKHLATKGRLGVIGNISGYKSGESFGETAGAEPDASPSPSSALPRSGYRAGAPIGSTLLWKSASVRGFFLPHFPKHVPQHFDELRRLVDEGTITSGVDPQVFRGVDAAVAAVEYLLSGESCGKVVLRF